MSETEADFGDLVGEGLDLLSQERDVLRSGDFPAMPALTAQKRDLLSKLQSGLTTSQRSAELVAAIESLVAEARRNEMLLRAAIQGLAAAKRRIKQILEMGNGAVAYAEDGTRIASQADAHRHTSQA